MVLPNTATGFNTLTATVYAHVDPVCARATRTDGDALFYMNTFGTVIHVIQPPNQCMPRFLSPEVKRAQSVPPQHRAEGLSIRET
jgi:hypothetical protein